MLRLWALPWSTKNLLLEGGLYRFEQNIVFFFRQMTLFSNRPRPRSTRFRPEAAEDFFYKVLSFVGLLVHFLCSIQ